MPNRKYTPEVLQNAVSNCTSIRGVLYILVSKRPEVITKRCRSGLDATNIDTSHFTGRGWARGQTQHTNESIAALTRVRTVPDEIVLSKDAPFLISKSRLRAVVLKYKVYVCEECGCDPVWRYKPLTLHLDHVNGDNRDNRLENLRFLCPNCHQQTPTWGTLNARRK